MAVPCSARTSSAVNLATGALVGGFALSTQGEYVIAGLRPGSYVVAGRAAG